MKAKLTQKLETWGSVLIAVPVATGVVIALRLSGLLQVLEWGAFDRFTRTRPREPIDDRIVIVTIDETDLRNARQWPIDDATLARVLETLDRQQPRAIGLDLYRDLPVPPGGEALENAMRSMPNLIGVEKVTGEAAGMAVNPPPTLPPEQIGAADLMLDRDGKVRRGLLSLQPQGEDRFRSGLGAILAQMYLQQEGIEVEAIDVSARKFRLGKAVFEPFRANDGSYVGADAGGYQILLNYRGTQAQFRTLSLTDVLEERIPPDFGRDRLIFIGATAQSLNDLFFTPYNDPRAALPDRTPGVAIHANITSQILSSAIEGRPPIRTWEEPLEWLWIGLWATVGAILSQTLRSRSLGRWSISPLLTGGCLLLVGGGLVAGAYVAFWLGGWWIPLVPALLAFVGATAPVTIYIAIVEQQDRQVMMSLFERHVSESIAQTLWRDRHQLLAGGQLVGRSTTATVLFSDLKGFTAVTERMDAEALMVWLNEYMDAMADVVLDRGGTIDKFIGDAVMAVFGVPILRNQPSEIAQDAIAAVECALEMGQKLEVLNRQWAQRGQPTVSMRVGIATGTVVAGSLGSARRVDYTIVGDTVNVAARLESYDKSLEGGICRILMSDTTAGYVGNRVLSRALGKVVLKGRKEAIDVFQVIGKSSANHQSPRNGSESV